MLKIILKNLIFSNFFDNKLYFETLGNDKYTSVFFV